MTHTIASATPANLRGADSLRAEPDDAGAKARPREKKRSRDLLRMFGAIAVAGALSTVYFGLRVGEKAPPPQTSDARETRRVVALGRLEPQSEIVVLAAPTSAGQGARIGRLLVEEGDAVNANQIVAELDSLARADADVASAQADVDLKETALARTGEQISADIAARQMALARAEADLAVKNANLKRSEKLARAQFESAQSAEQRRLDRDLAARTVEEARAMLKRTEAVLGGVSIDIAVARRELTSAKAALARAKTVREESLVRAVSGGRVLRILSRAGERISSDGLLELGQTDKMMARVEVHDADVARLAIGASCEARAAALGATPLTGKLSRIGLIVKRQNVVNSDPSANTDLRVVEARIALDADSTARAAAFSRLQVRATCEPAAAPDVAEAR